MRSQFFRGHSVDTRTSLIACDRLQGWLVVLLCHYCYMGLIPEFQEVTLLDDSGEVQEDIERFLVAS